MDNRDSDQFLCTVVVAAIGNYLLVEGALARTLSCLDDIPDSIEIIICCDGALWKTTPLIQSMFYRKNTSIIEIPNETGVVGELYNLGIKRSKGRFLTFIWPGVTIDIQKMTKLCRLLDGKVDLDCLYTSTHEIETELKSSINYGWLQCRNLISLEGAIFRKAALEEIQGFSINKVFQRYPDWDVFLRLSKYHTLAYSEQFFTSKKWSWNEYPFLKTFPFENNLIHRVMVNEERDSNTSISGKNKISVTITGGYWEATHNQLCFYNYFETEKGREQFTWKPIFDFDASESDLEDSDIVIISRGRHRNVLDILDYCNNKGIPTLYMLDDNWFTVADDWPEYRAIFSPGKPDYEVFIRCLQKCTASLVYNPILEQYVKRFSNRTYRMDVNINLSHFKVTNTEKEQHNNRRIIGYAGSPRKNDAAFEGLSKFIIENPDWEVLLYGNTIPVSLLGLKNADRLRFLQYTNYHRYARNIAQIHPDILLAPLDDSIFSSSKCPNKLLEITAAGAVGIYSEIYPYSSIFKNNIHGLFVPINENDNPDYWYQTINYLANNTEKRKQMYINALNLVTEKFDTLNRYNDFFNIIYDVINNR
jgi:glycosyltransferase involved in cell wall biosynthesis